ncbi:universal stress protein UspA [Sulfitobacter sp. EhC04]|uniref:universal stress protein n=1 Tax=Sulfitobacter sp. EhC04 TaxID=1849168 RepID=UPI0007F4EEFB|nr:universal stress protein [Sulfitobacter sp. EhC04]OAN67884.1 universal stress protein UspA [Sulfitobacter sp. EhC04]
MFKSILIAFDGSEGSQSALRKGAELAKLSGAELTVLTLYRHHSVLEGSMYVNDAEKPDDVDEIMKTHAKEVAERGASIARESGCEKIRAFVKGGPTARTIVSFSQEHKNDLIVMGSRGMGSIEGFLLGSVSHKVTSLSKCPVLVV